MDKGLRESVVSIKSAELGLGPLLLSVGYSGQPPMGGYCTNHLFFIF